MTKYFTAKELKERLGKNDNRGTCTPYLLLLRNKRTMIVDGDYGGERRYVEQASGDYHTADTKRELIKTIKSWYSEDEDFNVEEHNIREFYEEEWEDTINVFLTDEGYKDHMISNGHNIGKHDTYGIHAFRNKEMASLINLVDENIKLQKEINELSEKEIE